MTTQYIANSPSSSNKSIGANTPVLCIFTAAASTSNEPITAIIDTIKDTLSRTAPELSADIYDKGIIMTGGGSLLRGLDAKIRQVTGLSVNVIDDSLICVCKGTARILEDLEKYRPVLIASSN